MLTKNTPPAYGESAGPMIVAYAILVGNVTFASKVPSAMRTCQLNKSSPTGPALQEVGGSLWRS